MHTTPSLHMPNGAGNMSRMGTEQQLQVLPELENNIKNKGCQEILHATFPCSSAKCSLLPQKTGITHAVLYILSKEDVKEGGGKGAEFSQVQNWIKLLNAKYDCINYLAFAVERSTAPHLTSASYPLIYTEKRWGCPPFQRIIFLTPDVVK